MGNPLLYGTSKQFLIHFGLNRLGDLPSIEEFDEFAGLAADEALEIARTTASAGERTEAGGEEGILPLGPGDPLDAALESDDDDGTAEEER